MRCSSPARTAALSQLCQLASHASAQATAAALARSNELSRAAAAAANERARADQLARSLALRGPARCPLPAYTAHPALSIPRAAEQWLATPDSLSPLMLHVRATADALAIPIPRPAPVRMATPLARRLVLLSALTLSSDPSADTLREFMCAVRSYSGAVLTVLEKRPARLLNPDAEPEPPPVPKIHRVPPCALDWQTKPVDNATHTPVQKVSEGRKHARTSEKEQIQTFELAKIEYQNHGLPAEKTHAPKPSRSVRRVLSKIAPRKLSPYGRTLLTLR